LAAEVDKEILGKRWHGKCGVTSNANWFNFATWGTYSLGPNIRNDSAPQRLDSLASSIRRWVTPAIVHSRSADGDLVGRALSWGEYMIFSSVAAAAINFLNLPLNSPWEVPPSFLTIPPDTQFPITTLRTPTGPAGNGAATGAGEVAAGEVGDGRVGDGPRGNGHVQESEQGRIVIPNLCSEGAWFDESHEELVNEAFRYYWLARQYIAQLPDDAPDPGADPVVCRLLLLGTILLTAVEQDIVDSAIRTVIDSVPVRVVRQLDGRLARIIAAKRRLPREVVALNLVDQTGQWQPILTDNFARFMTSELLVMVLPRETLRVGRDIPALDCVKPLYAAALDGLGSPPMSEIKKLPAVMAATAAGAGARAPTRAQVRKVVKKMKDALGGGNQRGRLVEVVESMDRTGQDGVGSAARDWRRFDDRLNWAICLFRSRQQDPTLFWPAYSHEDENRLRRGQLPRGRALGPISPPLTDESGRAIKQFLSQVTPAENKDRGDQAMQEAPK
jgi:hypothetical protein